MVRLPTKIKGASTVDGESWNLIKNYSLSSNDVINCDTGTISPTYDMYKIIGVVESSSIETNAIFIRLNGITSSSYSFTSQNNNTISTTSLTDKFEITSYVSKTMGHFEVYVTGKNSTPATYPYGLIIAYSTSYHNGIKKMIYGNVNGISTVTSILVYSNYDCTTKIQIYGKNLS